MNSRAFIALTKRLRRSTSHVEPALVWRTRTREQLLSRVQKDLAMTHSLSWSEKVTTALQSFLPTELVSVVRGPVLAFLSVFMVVAGGSIASVSAAERSVPGDFLYPLKIAREQASIALASTPSDKLRLKTEYVGRRVDEIKQIAKSNDDQKGSRLKQAAEGLKQDVETVKAQLTEVKQGSSPRDTAEVALLVDQQTTAATTQLKDVKGDVSSDARASVNEAQSAVLNTGVKALQVLIDTQSAPDAQGVVTGDVIVKSIQDKVQGIEANVSEAEQKLVAAGVATSTTMVGTSSTSPLVATSSTTSLVPSATSSSAQVIQLAKSALDQTKQMIVENKLDQAGTNLDQAAKAAASLDVTVAKLDTLGTTTSSTVALVSATSTASGAASSTGSLPATSSSTSTASASTSTVSTTSSAQK